MSMIRNRRLSVRRSSPFAKLASWGNATVGRDGRTSKSLETMRSFVSWLERRLLEDANHSLTHVLVSSRLVFSLHNTQTHFRMLQSFTTCRKEVDAVQTLVSIQQFTIVSTRHISSCSIPQSVRLVESYGTCAASQSSTHSNC